MSSKPTPLRIDLLLAGISTEQRRLGGYVLLAACLHFVAFAWVEILYPPPQLAAVQRARVTIAQAPPGLAKSSSVSSSLSTLVDPAFFLTPQTATAESDPARQIPATRFEASEKNPAPKPAHGVALGLDIESPQAMGAVPFLAKEQSRTQVEDVLRGELLGSVSTSNAKSAARSDGVARTTAVWSPSLAQRIPQSPIQWPVAIVPKLPEASYTLVRLAVQPDGRVAQVLLEQSCGIPALDRDAVGAVSGLRFQPAQANSKKAAASGPLWGSVQIWWNYQPAPPPASVAP